MRTIEIPEGYVDLCNDWSRSANCMLYAVASTGGLTIGTMRPEGCDDNQWHYTIWRDLSVEVHCAVRAASKGHEDHEDRAALVEFEVWVDCMVDQLCEEYGLADWDG